MGCKTKSTKCSTRTEEEALDITDEIKVDDEKIDSTKLKEIGRLQYFFHSPSSKLPIRDVLGEQKDNKGELGGHKTEPHIEVGAENYLSECRQTNIKAHLNRDEKYLFLVTTRTFKDGEKVKKDDIYIVGYIVKEEKLIIEDEYGFKRKAAKGKTVIYQFNESIPYYDIFPYPFKPIRLVDEKKTQDILNRFPKMDDQRRVGILRACVEEIEKLDEKNRKEDKTCLVLRGGRCRYQGDCLRRNP